MTNNHLVYHEGQVVEAAGKNAKVKIISQAACTHCHAKSMCSVSEVEEKIIDAVTPDPLQIGDTVTLIMEEKLGRLAIFYGYFLPFVVMVVVLFAAYGAGFEESQAALLGIGGLVPYYLGLYVFRRKIAKNFVVRAEKKNNAFNEVK
ncbi:MAG: SoxR reducing system RseC family protein [bacterium]|nr:SoxR reducing system RseC family protein [bacterium]